MGWIFDLLPNFGSSPPTVTLCNNCTTLARRGLQEREKHQIQAEKLSIKRTSAPCYIKIWFQNCKLAMLDRPCPDSLTEGARSDPDAHFVEREASRRES